MSVVTRFAPSPTGDFHVGGAKTALMNYLYAKSNGGRFLFRIEDTDRTRYKPESTRGLLEGLDWLGLKPDDGPSKEELIKLDVPADLAEQFGGTESGKYVQSMRKDKYVEVAHELVDRGLAYPVMGDEVETDEENWEEASKEMQLNKWRAVATVMARKLLKTGRPHHIRVKFPRAGSIIVHDTLRGNMIFSVTQMSDWVLLKTDGMPTYHLASVVDDHNAGVTDVLRGSEWISSSPLHVFLYDGLDWEKPNFTHLPLILNPVGSGKMSKRAVDGSGRKIKTSVMAYMNDGYLPEALLNYLALLGWNPGSEEPMSVSDMIGVFKLKDIKVTNARWDERKLDNISRKHIKKLNSEELSIRYEEYLRRKNANIV